MTKQLNHVYVNSATLWSEITTPKMRKDGWVRMFWCGRLKAGRILQRRGNPPGGAPSGRQREGHGHFDAMRARSACGQRATAARIELR